MTFPNARDCEHGNQCGKCAECALAEAWREVERLRAEGGAALAMIREAPLAISEEADFDAMTWTFKIGPDCRTGGGTYALVWMGPNVELRGAARLYRAASLWSAGLEPSV